MPFDTAQRQHQARTKQVDRTFRRHYQEQHMKRTVTFGGDQADKRFEMIRTALLNAGDGKAERNRERVRREARLLDLLDSVSEIKDPAQPDGDRILRKTDPPQQMTLDQPDHKLLEDYLNATPWLPRAARQAVDVQDWWESAEKVDSDRKARTES